MLIKKIVKCSVLLAAVSLCVSALPSFAGGDCQQSGHALPQATTDIVDTAVAAGQFNTLAAALTAAGLIETLKGKGPFTVFAPTDEAFKKIPEKDLQALLADKAKLTKVLTYHVLAGNVKSSSVTKSKSLKTVEGSELPVTLVEKSVKIGEATVTTADISCSNGTIHIIDSVLMPAAN